MSRLTAHKAIEHLRHCSQSVAAWCSGCSPRTFRDRHVPRNPDGSYNVRDVIQSLIQARDEVDLASGPSDSPSLERWRRARALREEAELLIRLGELESKAEMAAAMVEVATAARHFAERMIAQHGNGIETDWLETVEEIDRSIWNRLRLDAKRRELTVYVEDQTPITIDLTLLGGTLRE